jgi:hypothetical protein
MSSKNEQESEIIKNYPPLQLPDGITAEDIVNRTVSSGLRVVHFDCRDNKDEPIKLEHPTLKAAKKYLKSVSESQEGNDATD